MCLRVPGGRKPYLPQRTQVKNTDVILSHGALQEGGVVQHQPGVALPHACGINHTRTGAKGAHISLENAIYWENPNSWRCPLCCMTQRNVVLAVEPWAVSELGQPRMIPVVLITWNCRVQDPASRCLRKGLQWHWLAGARADRMQRGSAGAEGRGHQAGFFPLFTAVSLEPNGNGNIKKIFLSTQIQKQVKLL